MGFFTDKEKASLRISNMILHVVGPEPFQAARARKVEHERFFIDKIVETAVDPVWAFDDNSATQRQLEGIASRRVAFEPGAQSLAASFARQHVAGSADGALFLFELRTLDPDTSIYSLIKYDYREALEQDSQDPDSMLRRIVNAFVDDKRAVQKSALVRVVNGVADGAVAARDRMKHPPEITEYFARFLAVTRCRSNEELSARALDVVKTALASCKADLPKGGLPRALAQAKDLLATRTFINQKALVEAVIFAAGNPQDDKLRKRLENATKRKIKKQKLDNLSFVPDRQVLARPATRRLRTAEGVSVFFPDGKAALVKRVTVAGGEQIIIDTCKVTDDDIVADRAR